MSRSIRFAFPVAVRRRFVRAVAAILCAGSAPVFASVAVLREQATVDAAEWRLADVADLSNLPESLARSVGQQVVWPSPPPCRSARLSRSLIEKRLRELSRGAARGLELGGARQVDIARRCQHLDAARVQVVAREALASWLASRCARFEIDGTSMPERIDLPVGRIALAARALPAEESLSPRMQVWVDIRVDDSFVRAVPLAFQIRAFRPAWVASRDLHPGESPAGAALDRREVDVATAGAAALDELPARSQLKRPLLSGQVLTTAHVEALPPVQRGGLVTVRSAIGAIDIEARGEALQDGRPGQRVWVRLATSTGPIHTRVVGAGLVEVRE